MKITAEDIVILPAGQAECNNFKSVYVLVIDTKSPDRKFKPLCETEWLPKDKAELIKQQILENQKIVDRLERKIKTINDDISDWEPTSPSMMRSKQVSQEQIRILKTILSTNKDAQGEEKNE